VGVEAVAPRNKRGRWLARRPRLPQDGDSGSWDDWSEKKERARKKSHDRWLKTLLGSPPYEYPWGAVTSSFNPRSASSSIVISYRAPGE
jgi:hypothetical protein